MNPEKDHLRRALRAALIVCTTVCTGGVSAQTDTNLEEITVWGKGSPVERSHRSSSRVVLTAADTTSINAMTTEDLVKFQPSLIIRQRFIGDPNGTMGMRTSNMFQTTRSMVFADGVPLH